MESAYKKMVEQKEKPANIFKFFII